MDICSIARDRGLEVSRAEKEQISDLLAPPFVFRIAHICISLIIGRDTGYLNAINYAL